MLIESLAWLELALGTISTTYLKPSTGATVHLAVAPFTPTPTSVPSGFTEASFTGYNEVAIMGWGAPHRDSSGNIIVNATTIANFAPTAVLTTPVQIAGYWVLDELGNYLGAEAFMSPPTLSGPSTPLSFTLGVPIMPGSFTAQILP